MIEQFSTLHIHSYPQLWRFGPWSSCYYIFRTEKSGCFLFLTHSLRNNFPIDVAEEGVDLRNFDRVGERVSPISTALVVIRGIIKKIINY